MSSLSLDKIQNDVLLFSNPIWSGQHTIPSTIIRNLTALNHQFTYSDNIVENLTVLVSAYSQDKNDIIQGLLYVPDIPDGDPCSDIEKDFIPAKVVRQADLPPTNYNLIALAPWISQECSLSYLAAARQDPLRGFIFYQYLNDTSAPPPVDDPAWDLDDGGSWLSQNHFPIFAAPGAVGQQMMYQLGRYSGNLSMVPFGDNITQLYDPNPDDYVRIWTELMVTDLKGPVNIWVYFLIVIGVLIVVITSTSCLMHLTWRRRRGALRRRVIGGDVNLEAMGIKRLTVPKSHVQKAPLYTYYFEPPKSPSSAVSPIMARKGTRSRGLSQSNAGNDSSKARTVEIPDLEYQPRCFICLDDFQNRATVIRELSCGHIYHPECIDEFLTEISSLCPICKASMLPQGYCPPITNGMARRERAVRRLRSRAIDGGTATDNPFGLLRDWTSGIIQHVSGAVHRIRTPKPAVTAPPRTLELQSPVQQDEAASPEDRTQQTRQRMRELAGSEVSSEDGGATTWQRARRTVFPGFR